MEKLEIEQAGPLRAVILAETRLAPSGMPASGFHHRARIHAFVGSPLVQVDYFVANTDSRNVGPVGGSMSSMFPVKSVALAVKPAARIVAASHTFREEPTGKLVQKTAEAALVQSVEQRRRMPGWIALRLESGGSVHTGVEAFAEQYPKALH